MESTLHDKPMEKYIEKRKYEKSVSECKKWRSLIKKVVGRNITVISNVLDSVRSDYGEIINASEISISIDKIYDVWNESDIETATEKHAVDISAVCLLIMIEFWVSQGIFLEFER